MTLQSSLHRMGFHVPLLVLLFGACSDSGTEPPARTSEDLFVLNSTGQTLASFSAGEGLEAAGSPVDLGAGFDGDAFDLASGFAVATVSSFGGSRILFVDLGTGAILTASFPAPEGDLANPSAPSFDTQGNAWIGGRGSDALYRARPGDPLAERIASDVGTFIERIVPVGERLYAVDANIDDDGGSYQPLGPGRIVVLSRTGVMESVIELPPAALNPTEAVAVGKSLVVLAAGTFEASTFLPANDGVLVVVDVERETAGPALPLGANGVSLELGGDGLVYVTATSDFESLSLLRFDPVGESFVRGPTNPIRVVGRDDASVDCWSATALEDGRLICVTFSFAEAGRLVLVDEDGAFIDEVASGFGSTDVATR